MKQYRSGLIALAIFIIFVIFSFLKSMVTLYTDWLWFKQVGYASVFTRILTLEIIIGICAAIFFFIFLYANMLIAKRMAPTIPYWFSSPDNPFNAVLQFVKSPVFTRFFNLIMFAIAAVISLSVGLSASGYWGNVLRFMNQASFGMTDPIFNKDIGFHIFSIPFYQTLISISYQAIILAAILSALVHIANGGVTFRTGSIRLEPHTKAHMSVLFAMFFALLAVSFRLNSYDLLRSSLGIVYGATYTDIHAKLPALTILFYSSILAAVLFLINIYYRGWRLPILSIAFIVAVAVIVGGIYPAIVQQYSVAPNEIEKETPYIKNSIEFTSKAYGLDKFELTTFPADLNLNQVKLAQNKDTIDNIRLWDWQPLLRTYNQIQSIRLYYDFTDVDVDRYRIGASTSQVALAAREMNSENLPENARTWLNQHLVYTHGYGIVANKVNEITEDGLPNLIVRNIPPVTELRARSMTVTRPEIYFGEMTNDYIIVDTRTKEFDYPKGSGNQYTKYIGKDGINVGGFVRQALFGLRFDTISLLLADSLTDRSRIVFYRNINERVSKIAPFLSFSQDPYIVVDKGRLYWIIDAFTTNDRYPYSTPYENNNNYIRNSVKAVVDAYNGSVSFYIFDEKDPIIRTYKKALPGLFKDKSQMPKGLFAHIRYPEELFAVQSDMYATFHMKDPQVFYNKEDLWTISKEHVSGTEQAIEPYYMELKLPGEEHLDFSIINSFTPTNKNNMIAWMSIKSDPVEYGQATIYELPKQRLIYGPTQIEARIDQTPDISQQLTLWNQQGSRVIRGTIFVVPIDKSLIYIEPLYLQSEQTQLPELKRVIAVYGSSIVMETNLSAALDKIFGAGSVPAQQPGASSGTGTPQPKPTTPTSQTIQQLIDQAQKEFEAAQQKQRQGDWTGYGEELKKLQDTLNQLKQQSSR